MGDGPQGCQSQAVLTHPVKKRSSLSINSCYAGRLTSPPSKASRSEQPPLPSQPLPLAAACPSALISLCIQVQFDLKPSKPQGGSHLLPGAVCTPSRRLHVPDLHLLIAFCPYFPNRREASTGSASP